jgi:glycosyltransferase involved in cell wall biosynthesis
MQSDQRSDTKTQISVIIPWSGRLELARTLERNLEFLNHWPAEIIVVNCGGNHDDLTAILAQIRSPFVRQIGIPIPRFNKALALNLGIDAACASTVLTLDSDVLLNADSLSIQGIDLDRAFFSVASMRETSPAEQPFQFLLDEPASALVGVDQVHTLRFTWADGSITEARTARKSLVDGNRAGAGLVMARKAHFLAIGGYRSDLEYWGWEDNDLQFRLQHVLELVHVEGGYVEHITHGDELRAMYGKDRAELTFLNLKRSVAAFARSEFQGSFLDDVRAWSSRITSDTSATTV